MPDSLVTALYLAAALACSAGIGYIVLRQARRMAEARAHLRERVEQLEVAGHAFERMAMAVMIINASGRILTVNYSYTRITGHSSEEVLGRQESAFRNAMQPQSFYEDLYAEVLRTGHWDGTTWCRRRDGTVYREWRSVSAVRDADGRATHYVALFRELDSHGGLEERPAKSA